MDSNDDINTNTVNTELGSDTPPELTSTPEPEPDTPPEPT